MYSRTVSFHGAPFHQVVLSAELLSFCMHSFKDRFVHKADFLFCALVTACCFKSTLAHCPCHFPCHSLLLLEYSCSLSMAFAYTTSKPLCFKIHSFQNILLGICLSFVHSLQPLYEALSSFVDPSTIWLFIECLFLTAMYLKLMVPAVRSNTIIMQACNPFVRISFV